MNDNEYLMKNYGVEIEEGVILRVLRPRRITPSEISIILIIIHSKYFPNSDWLKAYVKFTITSY